MKITKNLTSFIRVKAGPAGAFSPPVVFVADFASPFNPIVLSRSFLR